MLPFIVYRMYIAKRIRRTRQRTENLKRTTELVKQIDAEKIMKDAMAKNPFWSQKGGLF